VDWSGSGGNGSCHGGSVISLKAKKMFSLPLCCFTRFFFVVLSFSAVHEFCADIRLLHAV
jgi:hypothetical protein